MELKKAWKGRVVVELVPQVVVEVVGGWMLVQLEVRCELECLGVASHEVHEGQHLDVAVHVDHGGLKILFEFSTHLLQKFIRGWR